MWNTEVENCFSQCTDKDYCNSFKTCKGWGCRLLRYIPKSMPTSEYERAKIFSAVYSEAEKLGVIHCKNFNSLRIDEVLEDDQQLRLILDSGVV